MALLWMDGFDYLSTASGSATFLTRYDYFSAFSASDLYITSSIPRYTGGTSFYIGRYGGLIAKNLGSQENVIYTGFGIRPFLNDTATDHMFIWQDGASTAQCYIRHTASGDIEFWSNGVVVASSINPADGGNLNNTISSLNWIYISVYILVGTGTTGEVVVKVNGATWIDRRVSTNGGLNTQATANAWIDRFEINFNQYSRFDDLWIDNSTDHGDCRIVTLMPSADVGTNEWTGVPDDTVPNHYTNINTITPDDASYLETASPLAKEQFNFDPMPSGIWDIIGVNPLVRAQKMDAGSHNIFVKVDNDLGKVSTHNIIDSIKYTNDLYEGYDTVAVDAIQVQVEYE